MQGKGFVKFFAIVLSLVCLYQLSFTWVAKKVEKDAAEFAKGDPARERAYLDSIALQPVYPLFGHTYQKVKENEIQLGLDLKGGMNVTMQISLSELVRSLADNNKDQAFNQALKNADEDTKTSQKDYITLFVQEYEKLAPNGRLAALFSNPKTQNQIKFNASNSDVETYLKAQAKSAVERSYNILRTRIDKFGVTSPNIQLQEGSNRILIELPGVTEANTERVRKLLQGSAKLEFYETFDNRQVFPVLQNINGIVAASLKSAKGETPAAAKTDSSAAKTDTAKAGGDLLSRVKESEATKKDTGNSLNKNNNLASNPVFSILTPAISQDGGQQALRPGPVVGYAQQKDTARVNAYLSRAEVKSIVPANMKLLWSVKPINETKTFELYAIKTTGVENGPVLAGDVIADAKQDYDPRGNPEVTMSMNAAGAAKWRTITAQASADPQNKQAIAIVLDNTVYSAPTVQNEISGGNSSISGNFTVDDTKDLSNVLKAGRLPAPAHIVSEAVVGPSLGQEAINSGLISCVVGLVVVLVFMMFYYNRAGTVANIAVFVNVFFLMGVLSSIGAVLTLPGIAGIVLTLGMAVDANVLIYERIREELNHGKSLRIAIADGYKHALPSILDSQITTFLTGIILAIFGSGPILGFATTLMIGIVTSLFTSILISRIIFEWMLGKGWDIKFSNKWSDHTFKNANFAFVKNRKYFYIASALFIGAGIVSMATRGFSYGVDFKGGRTYVVRFDKSVETQEVKQILDKAFQLENTEVKTFGSAEQVRISTPFLVDDNSDQADDRAQSTLMKGLNEIGNNKPQILSSQKVGPTIANDIKIGAIYAVVASIIVIAAYILIRFRKWQFSVGALVATTHDALLVLSFFSLFNGIMPFSLDIDQAFIAAILTVIGYSINDTVVVMDRIREYLGLHHSKADEPKQVINDALNNTLSRTIITALTVVFVLVVLFFFGGEVIRGFSFALLIGVCFGTYSSICVATPVMIDLGKKDLH
ncbi:MAG: protein translocase subunit SecDF [Mucilaginibacter polytrichastri]|nr:protein translocase subunit SecDF [Mucilaginibacter polytrichastri]